MDSFRSRSTPAARIAARTALILILGCASLTLSHCRMVGDRLTGVDVGLFKRDNKDCRKACQDDNREATRAENKLHQDRVRECDHDPDCLTEEQARHQAALETLRAQREACLGGCHHQGGGTIDN